jgi:hypothetical protein
MSRIEIEEFREAFHRFAELCYVISYNMKEGQDPTDEGWDILEEVHRLWLEGNIVLYKTILDEPANIVTQGGLFDKTADNPVTA